MNILDKIKTNKLLKSGIGYSFASTLSSLVAMVVSFLSMLWIGPEQLGVWQSVSIVNYYLIFMQLGIQSGLNLDLPLELGRGNKVASERLVQTGLFFAQFLSVLLFILGGITILVLFLRGITTDIISAGATIWICAIMSCFRLHYIATYRSAIAFDKLGKIYLVDSVINILLILFIYKYHYYGLLIYHALKEIVVTFLMYWYAPYRRIRPRFYLESFKQLLKRGIFMTAVNQIKGYIESIPRLLVLTICGTMQVGLFTPALSVGVFMNLIPTQVSQFLNPQFGHKYGQTHKAADMWPYLKKMILYVPLICLPIVAIGITIIPFIINWWLPKYVSSILPIQIMLVGYMFSSTFITRGFLITIKAYIPIFTLYFCDILFFFSIPRLLLLFIYNYDPLIVISIGLSIAYIITYLINAFVVRGVVFNSKYN